VTTPRFGRIAIAVVASLVGACVLVGCSEDRTPPAGPVTKTPTAKACVRDLVRCARGTSIGSVVPAHPRAASGKPIVLGMINQENTPVANFPELSQATQAGIDFVNRKLGGIDGRPLKLDVCNTKFSPEGSTSCAQHFVQEHVPAVLGGIDVFGNGISTLAANDIPFVGGIPVSALAVTSPNSYQWSGGTWGATVAFAEYSARVLHAKRVSILYSDYGPITDSAKYGQRTLRRLGVGHVSLVPYPITATDLSSAIQAAAATKPDAVFLLAADTGCKPAFDGVKTAGIQAKVFYVGACAVPKIIAAAGPAETNGAIFNVEGVVDPKIPNPDFVLYSAVIDRYGNGLDPVGAGTVTFRSFMNLYRVLRGIGAKRLSAPTITRALESQRDAPSFAGHTSTCDHHQIKGLPALCSPQQILAEMHDGQLRQLGTWIDVGRAYGGG
jgi:branched-chain amino acid transport system substrate-binding protein